MMYATDTVDGATLPVVDRGCGCGHGCTCGACRVPDDVLVERLVRHCAPTLAGLKCGSMFRVCTPHDGTRDSLEAVVATISHRGVRARILRGDSCGCLIYVYRPRLLEARLSDPEVRGFLCENGYDDCDAEGAVDRLEGRFAEMGMPHEIGVFLDYPMEDIRGYMENNGTGYKAIGCWKVYGDLDSAERRFRSYRHCRDVFTRRLAEGAPLHRLAVRA
ncbi:MAG: DUF3793 family protein [Candidatus Methanomethylophilaceae archaeon]|nr:DUF3793 family protein [Candidatus Methanomethylophilaceae archaeon]